MSSIVIREIDNTTGDVTLDVTDVVYVPGFTNNALDSEGVIKEDYDLYNKPQLVRTISEFNTLFGDTPPVYAVALSTHKLAYTSYPQDASMFDIGMPEIGYLYAKEVLRSGLPVLFEVVKPMADANTIATSLSADAIYTWFEQTTVDSSEESYTSYLGKLRDRGSYRFKYFTTGGYPLFGTDVAYTNTCTLTGTVTAGTTVVSITEKTGDTPITYTASSTDTTLAALAAGIAAQTFERFTVTASGATLTLVGTESSTPVISVDSAAQTVVHATTPAGAEICAGLIDKLLAITYPEGGVSEESALITGRGDAVLLLDPVLQPKLPLTNMTVDNILVKCVQSALDDILAEDMADSAAACFVPWYQCSTGTRMNINGQYTNKFAVPGSLAYLTCMGKSLVNYDSWYAIANVNRGLVPNLVKLLVDQTLTNRIANSYQINEYNASKSRISVNGITLVNSYGYCIWGNHTLQKVSPVNGRTAVGYLNIRNLVCDVKKVAYDAAKSLMFDPNTNVLIINFKSKVMPTLDLMVSNQGLKDYRITVDKARSTKQKLYLNITIVPTYAVEAFDITINITDEEVTVEEA